MTENVIFFLKLEKELPYEFFHMSQFFSEWRIKLIPVAPHELSGLMAGDKCHVICLTRHMGAQERWAKLRKQFFDYAVFNNRVTLFHISSFSRILDYYRAEKDETYFHLPLPDEIPELVQKMAINYYQERTKDQKWPGGRRAKLPTN